MKHINSLILIIIVSIFVTDGITEVTCQDSEAAQIDSAAQVLADDTYDSHASVRINGPTSRIFDVRGKDFWEFIKTENNEGCICRILPSRDKGNFPAIPIFTHQSSGCVIVRNMVKKTACVNFSGCTGVLVVE